MAVILSGIELTKPDQNRAPGASATEVINREESCDTAVTSSASLHELHISSQHCLHDLDSEGTYTKICEFNNSIASNDDTFSNPTINIKLKHDVQDFEHNRSQSVCNNNVANLSAYGDNVTSSENQDCPLILPADITSYRGDGASLTIDKSGHGKHWLTDLQQEASQISDTGDSVTELDEGEQAAPVYTQL